MSAYRLRASGIYVPAAAIQRAAPHDRAHPIEGEVCAYLKDAHDRTEGPGDLVWRHANLFTSAGYARWATFLAAATPTPNMPAPNYIALGTSGTAVNAADTGLGMEIYRAVLVSATVTSTYTARVAASFSAAVATGNILEAGLYDNAGYPAITGGTATATAYTTTTLTDSGAAWTVNQWAGGYLYIVGATTGAAQRAAIASNTATVITLSAPITLPTGTVTYRISAPYLYAHAPMNVNKSATQTLNVTWQITVPSA